MEYTDAKEVEFVKLLKEKTDNCISIEEIIQIKEFLKEKDLFFNLPEIEIFEDPDKFIKMGLTDTFTGKKYNFNYREGEGSHGFNSAFVFTQIDVILNSSDVDLIISKNHNFYSINVSASGNLYQDTDSIESKKGNFNIHSNIVTLVSTLEKKENVKEDLVKKIICIYLGKKLKQSDADLAISFILKSLKSNQT